MHSVVHTIAGIRNSAGGPSRSVPDLCDALVGSGVRVTLVTAGTTGEKQGKLASDRVELCTPRGTWGNPLLRIRRFAELLGTKIRETEALLVHDHGLWLPNNNATASECRKLGVLRVVSPHGMLDQHALTYKSFKKRLAWTFYQRRDLESVAAFHATSEMEASNIRRLGFRQPIALIPNGVSAPGRRVSGNAARSKHRQALFLSRMHPIKGLPNLIASWAKLRPEKWRLLIVGPDEGNHREEVRRLIDQELLWDCVELLGGTYGEGKWKLLLESHLVILPSYSESFGIVVAEALAVGVPVITTKATPWSELESHHCGWWIDVGVEPLVKALRQALAMDEEALSEKGARGAALVAEKYSWPALGEKMLDFYRWLTGGGNAPSCLYD